MSTIQKYMELKRKVEKAQQKADKAEGALEQVMKQLKEEFDCPTLESAKKKLKLLKAQEEKAKDAFEEAVEEFEEKWDETNDFLHR